LRNRCELGLTAVLKVKRAAKMTNAASAAKTKANRAAKTPKKTSGRRASASLMGTTALLPAVIQTPPAPEISFEDAVAEGIRLVDEMNETDDRVQWRLGQLADEIEPEDGQPRYGNHTVAKFATRIGLAPCTVKRYRTVFRAWKEFRQKSAPGLLLKYSVARELAGLPDRESLIEKNPTMTKSQAAALRKELSKSKNETEEIRRWFLAMVKRANQDQREVSRRGPTHSTQGGSAVFAEHPTQGWGGEDSAR
jgi:hypothetical protein